MDALSIVSLEGNWDSAINTLRLDHAVATFHGVDADFIICSGTYNPASVAGECTHIRKLGERNADILRCAHDINDALIIPAYAFPFEFTYTTIAAFGNACVIGWLMSGLNRRSKLARVNFTPVSSGVHCRRVKVLNVRACEALTQFNIETTVTCESPSGPDDQDMIDSEEEKLRELTIEGGIIDTGRWFHGDHERSFDSQEFMHVTVGAMIKSVFRGLGEDDIRQVINIESIALRYVVMQVICKISAGTDIGSLGLDRIIATTRGRFTDTFDERNATKIVDRLISTIK